MKLELSEQCTAAEQEKEMHSIVLHSVQQEGCKVGKVFKTVENAAAAAFQTHQNQLSLIPPANSAPPAAESHTASQQVRFNSTHDNRLNGD